MSESEFFKMSASGNDFILIDNMDGKVSKKYKKIADFVAKICRRRYSVGADGVILIERSTKANFRWKFFNADGSEAEMCGNGGRCAARFAFIKGIAGNEMAFETIAGIIRAVVDEASVKLQLTTPSDIKLDYPINLEEKEIFLSSVNTGVPHAILLSDDIDHVPVEELGRVIRYHKAFGEKGTNVDFVQIVDRENILIRTYERGVEGETYACGTGSVAAGVILAKKGLIESPVNIITRGGETLKVYIDDEVYLEGNARIIYTGTLNDEAIL
jgi:diaminopimelate epimerase